MIQEVQSCRFYFVANGEPLKASPTVKNPPAMKETWVRSLGWEDSLEEVMATQFSILAWRIPADKRRLGSQRVGHDWATKHSTHTKAPRQMVSLACQKEPIKQSVCFFLHGFPFLYLHSLIKSSSLNAQEFFTPWFLCQCYSFFLRWLHSASLVGSCLLKSHFFVLSLFLHFLAWGRHPSHGHILSSVMALITLYYSLGEHYLLWSWTLSSLGEGNVLIHL